MGKIKRTRTKYHLVNEHKNKTPENNVSNSMDSLPLLSIKSNLFDNIDIGNLFENKLDDDVKSVKSTRSIKSTSSTASKINKKEKLKIRRELFLRKIETAKQVLANRKRGRKVAPASPGCVDLKDNLPSINLSNFKKNVQKPKEKRMKIFKGKPTEKLDKRKATALKNLSMYKKLIKKANMKTSIFDSISTRLKEKVKKDSAKL